MKTNQKSLTAQDDMLMIERSTINMEKEKKELEDKVRVIRQAIENDNEALRIETNRIAELNKSRMDEIFKLDDEFNNR